MHLSSRGLARCLQPKNKVELVGDSPMKKRKQSGFSLIELLIVVAIILIIAAIAIPNLLASRMAANESAAAQDLRTIMTSEATYTTTYNIGFSADLVSLGGSGAASSTNAQLIDQTLAAGTKSGYSFVYAPTNVDSLGHYNGFTINANPQLPGSSGRRYFYIDQSGVIRVNYTAVATISDPAI